MKTLTLDLPEHLAEDLAGVDPEFVIKVIEAGLEHVHQVSESVSEHPYVTRVPGKRGGRPIIRDTGITVSLIAHLYKAGDTVDEILESYPHLHPAWVHDAIGYYLDHQDEIEREIRESRVEYLAEQYDLTIDESGIVHFPKQGDLHGQ